MPLLEAGVSEEDVLKTVALVRKLWEEGDATGFKAAVYQHKLELWESELLFGWVENGPYVHSERERVFLNVTKHYELMHNLIEASTSSNPAFWDEDRMRPWIDLLTEHKYPWFVCKAWNHLTPLAISLLHESSLAHHHTSNLHKLLYQQLIDHLWWESDAFLESLNMQVAFFKACSKGKRGHAWRRELVEQFAHYPYDKKVYAKQTLKALVVAGQLPLLKRFLLRPEADSLWSLFLVNVCIEYEHVEMLQWVFAQARFIPTVNEWYDLACQVHPYHRLHTLHHNFKSPVKCQLLHILLQQFDTHMSKVAWLQLFTYTTRRHSFANLLVCTYQGERLLDYVWSRLQEAVAVLDFDDNGEYELVSADELRCVRLTRDVCACPRKLFQILEALTKSHRGWTALANALRWGTTPVVKWLVDHGADTSVSCESRDMHHNTLSLACYNGRSAVLKYVLTQFPSWILEPWLLVAYEDIVAALTRYTLPRWASVERFQWVLDIYTSVYTDVNHETMDNLSRLEATFKTKLIRAVVAQLNTVEASSQQRDHPREMLPSIQFMGYEKPVALLHPLLQSALRVPGMLQANAYADLFVRCRSRAQFEVLYTHLGLNDAAHVCNLNSLYDMLVQQLMVPSCRMSHACLHVMEQCPVFRQEMRNCTNSMVRIQLTSSWARHSAPLFEAYLKRARTEWRWNLSYDLNLIGWTISSRDPQRVRKWHALLSWGHYPLVAKTPDQVYQHLAKTYRVFRRALLMRGRALQTGKVGNGRRYNLVRVHWELSCVLPDSKRPVLRAGSVGSRYLMAGGSV